MDEPAAPVAWLQITVETERASLAEAIFESFDAEAVTVLDAGDDITVENTPHEHPGFEASRVTGLFTHGTLAAPIERALQDTLGNDATIEVNTLADEHWASAWLAQHPPLHFGHRLWIAPHEAPVDVDDDAIVVRLDPGLAFGTGTHPTTALCLEWLAEADIAGRHVLDYGCGSGILAVAAARLGAASVTAVDIDDQAVRATRENAERNGVSQCIETPALDGIGARTFDIVLANILAKPLIALAPTLTGHAAPGAPLVLSGLLTRQIEDVKNAYTGAFTFEESAIREDWVRLDARRNGHD
ncbi:ribosomal protein L11 methyltransferase [Salinisphaera dokdonensis CL-ES53]|uniref:Ribosomal protein L11 methyltransferase n=1 Tax=Salinisphaera dokdonensis CL-ES53 TaxID=1304272 RepID=A0ABV2B0S5_9GAMM